MSDKIKRRIFGGVFLTLSLTAALPQLMILPGLASLGAAAVFSLRETIMSLACILTALLILIGKKASVSLGICAAALLLYAALLFAGDVILYTDAKNAGSLDNIAAFILSMVFLSGVLTMLPALFVILLLRGRRCAAACVVFVLIFAAGGSCARRFMLGSFYALSLSALLPGALSAAICIYLVLSYRKERLTQTDP